VRPGAGEDGMGDSADRSIQPTLYYDLRSVK
jgi:hypothetical protein